MLRFGRGGFGQRWTPIFEPQGAFFKLAFFEAAPVVVSCLLLRA
jgi:hypothetical protein